MFAERMLRWARIFDGLTGTMSTMMIIAKGRMTSLLPDRNYRNNAIPHQTTVDQQRERAMNMAYAQLGRYNR